MNKAIKTNNNISKNKNIFSLLKNKIYNIFLLFTIFFSVFNPNISYAKTVEECQSETNTKYNNISKEKADGTITEAEYQTKKKEIVKDFESCKLAASDYVEVPKADAYGGGANFSENQIKTVLLEELPGLTNKEMFSKFESNGSAGFVYYINWLIRISIALGSIIAVATLIFGGFLYITTDNFINKGKGKSMIQNSLLGLLLILTSYVILGQINPDLLKIKFSVAKIEVKANEDGFLSYTGPVIAATTRDKMEESGYKESSLSCWSTKKEIPYTPGFIGGALPTGTYVSKDNKDDCRMKSNTLNLNKKDKKYSVCAIVPDIVALGDAKDAWFLKVCIFEKK